MQQSGADNWTESVTDWRRWREWRAEHAANLFATDAAWEWFARKHKGELIGAGVYIPAKGRAGGIVRVVNYAGPSIDSVVMDIMRREASGGDEAA